MNKRAALYARVSTDRQSREGDSIQAQLSALKEYCEKNNYDIAGIYIDDGVSGTLLDERDELQNLLDDVRKNKIDIIFFTKLDRYFRNLKHYLNTQEVLDKFNVPWKAIWEHYETATPQGRLFISQMLSFAQFEAEQTGQRINQVFDYKKQKHEVLSGKVPFGYCIKDSHYAIDEEKAEIVRKTFKRFIDTGSLGKTMLEMQGLGLPKTQHGLKLMLKNRRYIGEAHGVKGYLEPIIDEKDFENAQRMLAMNVKVGTINTYIFSGLIKCPVCGNSLSGFCDSWTSKKGKVSKYKGYRCFLHYRTIPTCSYSKAIGEKRIEKYLVKNLETLAFEDINADDTYKAADYQKQIENARKKIARLKDLYVNELIDLDEYKRDLAMYNSHIRDFEKCMSEYRGTDKSALKKLVGTKLDEWYWTLNEEEKRKLWRSVIEKIVINDSDDIKVFFL